MRRVYPGMSAGFQRQWQEFFRRAQNVKVNLRIEDLSSTTTSADATVAGRVDYVDSGNDNRHNDLSFAATFQRDGNGWKLVSLR